MAQEVSQQFTGSVIFKTHQNLTFLYWKDSTLAVTGNQTRLFKLPPAACKM